MRATPTSTAKGARRNVLLVGTVLFLLMAGTILGLVNDTASAQRASSTAADLAVNKSVDTAQPLPDQVVTFSIQIFNSGVISATNGTLNDVLDSSLTFVGPVTIEGGGDAATAGTPPTIASGLTISPSTGVTITFPVRLNSELAAGTVIKNTAVANSSEMGPVSSNEAALTVAAVTDVKWKQRTEGIFGGRINTVVIDPKNTAVLYAGSEGGLFKSSDSGASWQAANSGLDNYHIESIVLDPLDRDVLYAGTQAGVFKSGDGGGSWAAASSGLGGSVVSSLAIDPGDPTTLYAGTEAGIFKSRDGGGSWAAANAGLSTPQISALVVDPRHSATLYAGTQGGGVYKSSDGGGSWAPANSGLSNLDVHALGIDPSNSSTLYVGTGAGVFRSANSGSNWSASGADLASLAVFSLAIDPADGKNVYAGTESGVFKSKNSGGAWALSTGEGQVASLAIDPATSMKLYAGTADSGVARSDDGGESWNWSATGLTGTRIMALAIDAADKNLLFAGTAGSGVFKSRDGGGRWAAANDGLANLDIYALIIDPSDSSLLYAGTASGIYRSSDSGDSWAATNSGLTNPAVRALAIHPTNSLILYAGTAGGGVFRSSNGGGSWSAANNGLTDPEIRALAVDPGAGSVLYAATETGGVFKSSDGGSSWIAVNNGLAAASVTTLLIDPNNSQIIYAGGASGVFKSSDGGGSWAASGEGLGDASVEALAFDPANSGILYAATAAHGVFRSTGSGFNWTAVNDGLLEMNVRALALASSNTLYAGTTGAGLFSSGPHLAVSKQVDKLTPTLGETLHYTILISNTGTLPISDGTVKDVLSGKLSFVGPVSVEGGGIAVKTGSPPRIVKDLALEAGTTATVTLPVKVAYGLDNGTAIPNTAVVDAPQLHSPVSGQVEVIAYRPNKLLISQSVDDTTPQAGQTVNFTIEINATGNHGIGGITIMSMLDDNLTFVGPVQIIGSSGTAGSPPLIASGLEILPGRTIRIKYPARVNAHTLPGTMLEHKAAVTSIPWPVPLSSQAILTVSGPDARHMYVNSRAAGGSNDGSSWENAYTSLQDALLQAGSGSEIWVAAGNYYPDVGVGLTDNDPAATFHLRSGVAIYGGFAGTESTLDERDPAIHVTVLSGDIDGNDTVVCSEGAATGQLKGTNSRHVVTGSGTSSSALLDGFTIISGHAAGEAENGSGGGMFNEQGSPTLANILFCSNKAAGSGGGMYNSQGSAPTLNNVIFVGNEAYDGGGMSNNGGSPELLNVAFLQNKGNAVSGCGGGMANLNGSQPLLNAVIFNGNLAYYGGGLFNENSKATIKDATFNANKATWGGGVFNSQGSDGAAANATFSMNEATGGGGLANVLSSPTLTNVTFAANRASQWGGGMSSSGGDPALNNAVFSGNLAEAQANGQQSWGGGMFVSGGQPVLSNATVSGNWAAAKGSRPEDEGLGGGLFVAGGTTTIQNSILWGNEGDRTPDILVAAGGAAAIRTSRLDGCPQYSICENLVYANPEFALPVDPTSAPTVSGNFSLRPSSPLVDAGENDLIPAGIFTDRAGQARINNGVVDLGAFELSITCPAATVTRLYVDASVEDGNSSGLDWPNALSKLSHAFALAESCQEGRINEVWVAAGKYVTSDGSYAAEGARDPSFNLLNGLAVYGGFSGTELVLEERDWLENLTILSGDIGGDDLVDAGGIVTNTTKIVGGNSYHVVSSIGNDQTAVLDGFIINGGQAGGGAAAGDDSGGGIYLESSSPTLRHLTILGNMADDGGGMANIANSSPQLTNVRIEANRAVYFGGGVFNQSSSPKFTNAALFDNHATSGGGMFNAISNPLLVNATISGNRANSQQAAAANQLTPENGCGFQAADCRLQDLGGTAGATGSGGGMYNLNNSRPVIMNSIFWQNQDDNGSGTLSATIRNDAGSIPLIGHSLIQASGGSGSGWDGSIGFDQGQNIDDDPLFVAAENRHLLPGSPAIDVGDNETNRSKYDLDVKPRITDGTNDGEAMIDLGAYETTLVAITVRHTADTTEARVGDTVTFTYVVRNDGEVSLNEIRAVDDRLGEVTLSASSLEAGAWTSGTLSYVLQESDIGTLVSKVTVSGKSAAGAEVSDEDTTAIEVRRGVYRSFVPALMKGW